MSVWGDSLGVYAQFAHYPFTSLCEKELLSTFSSGVFGLPKCWPLDALCHKHRTKVNKNIAPTKDSLYFCSRVMERSNAFRAMRKQQQHMLADSL